MGRGRRQVEHLPHGCPLRSAPPSSTITLARPARETPRMARLAYALPLLLLPALFAAAPPRPERFTLDRRVPLTRSRVAGSPEPPPPFRTRRVLEKHAFRNPVYLTSHPAHDRLFVVEQNGRIVHLPSSGKEKPAVFC